MITLTKDFKLIDEKYLGSSYGDLYVRLYARYTEQQIDKNRTYVEYEGRGYFSGNTYIFDGAGKMTVKGTASDEKSTTATTINSGEHVFARVGGWVSHNPDGTMQVSAYARLNFPNWGWDKKAENTMALPTIPRASKLPQELYEGYVENNVVVDIFPNSSTFSHSLKLVINDKTWYVNPDNNTLVIDEIKSLKTNWLFNLQPFLYQEFTGSETKGKIILTTYNDTEKIGDESTATFLLRVDELRCMPVVSSATTYDTNEKTIALTSNIYRIIRFESFANTNFLVKISSENDSSTYLTKLEIEDIEYPIDTRSYYIERPTIDRIKVKLTNSRNISSEQYIVYSDFVDYLPISATVTLHRSSEQFGYEKVLITANMSVQSPFFNNFFGNNINKNIFKFKWRYNTDFDHPNWSKWYTIETEEKDFDIPNFVAWWWRQLKDENNNDIYFEYHSMYQIEYEASDLLTTDTGFVYLNSGVPRYSWGGMDFRVTDNFMLGGPTSDGNVYGIGVLGLSRLEAIGNDDIPTKKVITQMEDSSTFLHENKGPYTSLYLDINNVAYKRNNTWQTPSVLADLIYPVGSIYMSVNNTDPTLLFGGLWQPIRDKFLLSAGDRYAGGSTGGEFEVTLTTDTMPNHTHLTYETGGSVGRHIINTSWSNSARENGTKGSAIGFTGGGKAHNNMPPYLTVYMWQRTA